MFLDSSAVLVYIWQGCPVEWDLKSPDQELRVGGQQTHQKTMPTNDQVQKMLRKPSRVTKVTPESFAEAEATEREEVIRTRERKKESCRRSASTAS